MAIPANWNTDNSSERILNDVWNETSNTITIGGSNSDGSLSVNPNIGSILGDITYDEITVTRNSSNQITKLEYKLSSAVQATINVTRNGSGDITNLARA